MNQYPNILFINVDQLRYDALGYTGHPFVETPNIDSIAAQGMQFDSAYTPLPSCCPSRQSLITGVMPEQHSGLWNYGGGGSLPIPTIDPNRPVWVRQLQKAGYQTAYLGKWHVHPDLDPTAFGYDSFEEPPHDHFETPYKALKYPIKNNPWPEFPLGHYETLPVDDCHTHVLARKCIQKMDAMASGDAPWHLRLDFSEPHLPCVPAEPFASMYPPESIAPWDNFHDNLQGKPYIQKQQVRNWKLEEWTWDEWSVYMSGYLGAISQVDDAIGCVLLALQERGLDQNTVVIFTTDHGDAARSHKQIDKHYTMYEEVTHVPLIIRWPQVIQPNSVCSDFLSHFLDLPVTLLELLNLAVPDCYQGKSFLAQLRGESSKNARLFAFSSYNGQQFGLYCQRMIGDRYYKYVWNPTDVDELYNLEQDPYELNNLAALDEVSAQCLHYKSCLYDVFSELNDPMVTGYWNKRWLCQSPSSN